MHLLDGRPVLSASDLVGFLACEHLTQLELAALRGEIARPDRQDPELDVLTRRGEEHERRHLEHVRAAGGTVVEIAAPSGSDGAALAAAEAATVAAMVTGAAVIYQAAFFDGRWRGQADFLQRVDRPSRFGPWSYEPVDTKLARKVKAAAVLQLCHYAEHVERLQGVAPEHLHVVTGDGESSPLRLADFAASYRHAKARAEAVVFALPAATYPLPVEHCGICRWQPVCEARRRADDHLSLVAGMRRSQTARLEAVGVATVAALADAPPELGAGIGPSTLDRLTAQARLQVRQRATGVTTSELVAPVEAGRGLCLLPAPSPGDLFFDIEGDPFVGDAGVEYLLGVVEAAGPGASYRAFWGHDPAGEKRAFEAFVDLVGERLAAWPDMHVYHYGSYERTALCRLMGRHATRETEIDRLLRGGVLVDLLRVVRQGVRVSEESYSLKRIEHLYRPGRDTGVADGRTSIVAYEAWLASGDGAILDGIAEYNRDDCLSTGQLRDWLESRRIDAAGEEGPLPRPAPRKPDPTDDQAAVDAELAALGARLLAGVPDDPAERTADQAATWLLAQLLEYHRREDRPEWWAYFRRLELTDDELVDDADSIGQLTFDGDLGRHLRTEVSRYRFPPEQEHKVREGHQLVDPRTGASAGSVLAIDSGRGVLDLKRPKGATTHPRSVVPSGPLNNRPLRQAIARLASAVADHGLGGPGTHGAVADLLLGRRPRLRGTATGPGGALAHPGEDGLDTAVRLANRLDGSCLAVQGPPGSGKTYTGARMIVAMVAAGQRVGVTANSHKAAGNLLAEVRRAAAAAGIPLRALQKCAEHEWCGPQVAERGDNAVVVNRLAEGTVDVVAGTAWLFARPDVAGRLDTLVVDEAGKFSLANAVAAAGSATNLVLLGDPQQLAQPAKGVHPPGSAASVLQHVLGDRATIAPDRGLFLGTTWRMHPDLCAVVSEAFYDGRLLAHPSCVQQRVADGPWAGGSGLRFVPVEHAHNRTTSAQEVDEVVAGVAALVGRPWTDRHGRTRPLTLDDILVVAPYNTHVGRLQAALPPGARVGTVDKFQGQEAAVAIFSMATSSAADLPRNLEFLYSANRLNVAVSRARALAVVVASPALLSARCRRPEQLRLVNALCRLAELGRQPIAC
ncbi:MAG TPA: TM0106 family RecB-like putative nuclease [Acidimicrobiales bacterium]|nr:TM0106 family RecB-like putative nuclease [Acidimicrobiales bacterium]